MWLKLDGRRGVGAKRLRVLRPGRMKKRRAEAERWKGYEFVGVSAAGRG